MRTKTLIKTFTWTADDLEDVVLGPSTRINPKTNRAQLRAVDGGYPTTADLYVKSRLTQPKAARQWLGFEARVYHAVDESGAPLTSSVYRLDDGTNEFFWNGSSWAAASASDWNTEEEIAANIAMFSPATHDRKIRVVINLRTTDSAVTPQLEWIKILYAAQIDFQEDILYRSLIPALRQHIRPISQVVVQMPTTGATLNVSDLGLEAGYNVTGIDAVYDFDADAESARSGYATDLLSSYNAGTGAIALTGSVDAETRLWVRFYYQPEVAISTSQDYDEPSRLPSIVLTQIVTEGMNEAPSGDDYVADKAAGSAVVVPSPQQGHLEITLMGTTEKGVDQQRLQEAINAFFLNHGLLTSEGLDEAYTLQLIDKYESIGDLGEDEIHEGRARFRICNFKRWLKDAYTDLIVTKSPTVVVRSD